MSREQIQAHALVLRKVDYGDRDQILTLLIEGLGKRSAIAKGGKSSKKRFGGALDKFRLTKFTFADRGPDKLLMLAEAKVMEDYPGLETSFEKMSTASYATELVREVLQDAEGGGEIFGALVNHYRQTSASGDDPQRLETDLHAFTLWTMKLAGFAPSLTQCFRSGQPLESSTSWRFMMTGQGAIHPDHRREGERAVETTREVLEAMARLSRGYPDEVPELSVLRSMRPMMMGMVHSALGKDLRSREYLKMVVA